MAGNFDVSYIFEAINKFSPALDEMKKSLEGFDKQTKKTNFSLSVISKKFDEFGKKMKAIGGKLTKYITAPLVGLGTYTIKNAADLEELSKRFLVTTGSAEQAAIIMEKIKNISMSTEYNQEELADTAQKFIGLGFSIDDTMSKMEMLTKISEGSKDGLESVSNIYARMIVMSKKKGGIDTKTLTALTQQNIPIIKTLQKMAEEHGLNLDKLLKSSKGLKLDVIDKALKKIAIETPETLGDQFERLHNITRAFSADLGSAVLASFGVKGNFQEMNDTMQKMEGKFKAFLEAHKSLVKWGAIIAGIAAALAPVAIILSVIATLIGFIFNPWGALLIIITGIGIGLWQLYKHCDTFRKMVHLAIIPFKAIWDFILKIIDGVKSIWHFFKPPKEIDTVINAKVNTDEAFDLKAGILSKQTLQSPLGILNPLQHNVNSEITMNINDPGRNVQNVTGKSDGELNFNLGNNMGF